jgi:hypothetical protein
MSNSRPARRKRQAKSLKQRLVEAEQNLQASGAALMNMRQMYDSAVLGKADMARELSKVQALVAAAALQYGNRGELEIDARTIQEVASGAVAGYDYSKDDAGNIIILTYASDEALDEIIEEATEEVAENDDDDS